MLSVWQYNVQPVATFVFQFVTVALWGQTTLVNVTDIADNVPASLMRLVALVTTVNLTILTSLLVKVVKVRQTNLLYLNKILTPK